MANTVDSRPLYERFELQLVSPYLKDGTGGLKGAHLIKDTQYLLSGNSKNARNQNRPFGDFYKGELDGEYGLYTASAVRQAKWWMGYPESQINSVAGPPFQAYLRGNSKIPLTYNIRRNKRLEDAQQANAVRINAANRAITQIGVKESPMGSNHVLYSQWYGIRGPWCAMFVTWCFVNAGSKRFKKGSEYAFVPAVVSDARSGANGLHLTNSPIKGDLVAFDWNKDGTSDHLGIFIEWLDVKAGTFSTVEGNTSGSNDSNGGEVMKRTRHTRDIQTFIHVLEP